MPMKSALARSLGTAVLMASAVAAQTATAGPMRLDLAATASTPALSIYFTDTGDGLLSFNEITAFSGGAGFNPGNLYLDVVGNVPDSAYSVASGTSGNCAASATNWCFYLNINPGNMRSYDASLFSATLVDLSPPPTTGGNVPEPGSLALVSLAGLAAIGASRRRRG